MKNDKHIFADLEECFEKIGTDANGKLSEGKLEATQRFNEFVHRLELRFEELEKIEYEINNLKPDVTSQEVHALQLGFVDKVEGFYQHLYASLSAFAMYLNLLTDHDFKHGFKIGSIKHFLVFLQSKFPSLKENLSDLEMGRDFRAKFVDHVQQHTLHGWLTYSFPSKDGEECVIIYFIKKGNEIYYMGENVNPYSKDFKPPVNYKTFYVSPPHRKVRESFLAVVRHVIGELC